MSGVATTMSIRIAWSSTPNHTEMHNVFRKIDKFTEGFLWAAAYCLFFYIFIHYWEALGIRHESTHSLISITIQGPTWKYLRQTDQYGLEVHCKATRHRRCDGNAIKMARTFVRPLSPERKVYRVR